MIIQAPPPSGDWSGNTDTAALQAAIDSAQKSTPQYCGASAVMLSSLRPYWINRPLALGGINNPTRVVLRGEGIARIDWVGKRTSDYMLRIFGNPYGAGDVLRDLSLWCSNKSRGVLCSQVSTQSSIQGLYIRESVESALDLIDCWCCNLRNVCILYFNGFALRTRAANACHYDSLFALYGRGDTWPAEDDTYAVDFSGQPFQTSPAQRACLNFWGNGSTFTNLGFEQCNYGDVPLWYSGRDTQFVQVRSVRLEANRGSRQSVLIDGSRDVTFANVASEEFKAAERECFMRLKGITRGIALQRFWGWSGVKPDGNLILVDGGNHAGMCCAECSTAGAYIPVARWFGEINGAVTKPWDDAFNSNPQPIHTVPPIPMAE